MYSRVERKRSSNHCRVSSAHKLPHYQHPVPDVGSVLALIKQKPLTDEDIARLEADAWWMLFLQGSGAQELESEVDFIDQSDGVISQTARLSLSAPDGTVAFTGLKVDISAANDVHLCLAPAVHDARTVWRPRPKGWCPTG